MPSARRLRVLLLAVVLALGVTFYLTSDMSHAGGGNFYKQTMDAMSAHGVGVGKGGASPGDASVPPAPAQGGEKGTGADGFQKLKPSLSEQDAQAIAPDRQFQIEKERKKERQKQMEKEEKEKKEKDRIEEEKSTTKEGQKEGTQPAKPGKAGAEAEDADDKPDEASDEKETKKDRKKSKLASDDQLVDGEKEKEKVKEKEKEDEKRIKDKVEVADTVGKDGKEQGKGSSSDDKKDTKKDKEVEAEFQAILKRSPVIVFSKSYCPFSKKAKFLLGKYTITPVPHIVELDEHPLGKDLQHLLAEMTGRRTVPNVLVNGKSLGGGDDVEALHEQGKLAETVQTMAGKRLEIALREV
ncbi:hypothetical protein KEM52_003111 [Ascosphaera acerosa]|nr:hypothetical protein KEM52_003111 [Ascosphaera acerosa]